MTSKAPAAMSRAGGVPRRSSFSLGTAAGFAAGAAAMWYGAPYAQRLLNKFTPHDNPTPGEPSRADAMPGPFPGRVVEVHHPHAVDATHNIDAKLVGDMVD